MRHISHLYMSQPPPPLPVQEPPPLPPFTANSASGLAGRPPKRPPPTRTSFLLKVAVGDTCLAKWDDGQYYLAVVESDLGQDFLTVSFPANGDTKTVHRAQLRASEDTPSTRSSSSSSLTTSTSSTTLQPPSPSSASTPGNNSEAKRREKRAKSKDRSGSTAKSKLPRLQAIQELMNTERSFQNQLLFIINEFFVPLAQQKIISREEMDSLLLNLDEIVSLSSQLFGLLEEVVIVYQDETTTVGDVFLQFGPNFAVFFQYVAKQGHAKQVLYNLRKNKAWARFSVDFARSSGSTLESYLSLPLQRLPQYVSLLTQVKSETPEQHPDYVLVTKSLMMLNEHLSEVNGSIGQQALSELVTKFANSPGLKTLGRWLICEGRALVTTTDESLGVPVQKYHCFLFNDCFAFATYMPPKQKHEFHELRCKVPLDSSFVAEDAGDTKISVTRGEQISFILALDQVQDKIEWLAAFKIAISNVNKKNDIRDVYLSRTDVNASFFLAAEGESESKALATLKKKTPAGHIDHVNFENGSSYVGEMKNGKMHGRGIFYYANGDLYDGFFKEDKPNGTGNFMFVNGDRFHGEFADGKKQGNGTMFLANGDMIEGAWADDIQEGRGVQSTYGQPLFDGKWQQGEVVERVDRAYTPEAIKYLKKRIRLLDDMKRLATEIIDGKGRVSAHSFVMLLERCKKHGVMIKSLQPETHELKHWLASASAQMKILKEQVAAREVAEKVIPKQVMHMANGDTYQGLMKDGQFCGLGTYTLANGGKYEGMFAKNKKEGHGTFTDHNGMKFVGEFVNDKKHGPGVCFMANGDRIEGVWVDDNLHGRGTLTNKKDDVFDGVWENGKLVTKVLRLSEDAKDGGKKGVLSRMFSRKNASKTVRLGEDSHKAKVDARLNLVASPSLEAALVVPGALHFFTKFLAQECSEENIEFWHAVNNFFKNCTLYTDRSSMLDKASGLSDKSSTESFVSDHDPISMLLEQCNLLVSTFIGQGASRQVNISAALEVDVKKAQQNPDPAKRLVELREKLINCQLEVVKLMSTDSFRRFIKSEFWKEFLATGGETVQSGALATVPLPNGDLYEGEMEDGRFHGLGTYIFTNGDKYTGKFSKNLMHGYGEFTWKSGQRFIGEFCEHAKHGEGVMYEPNGDRVEASWSKGKLHGRGVHYSSTGQVYDGVWVNGVLDLKVDRTPQKLLAVFTYPDMKRIGKTKTRLVHCTTSVLGVKMGWKRGKVSREEQQNWRAMEKVEIDLKHPQIELHFSKHSATVNEEKAKTTLVIAPCDPFTVSSHLMTLMDLMERGELNQSYQSQTTLVRCKMLYARIMAGLRHQREKAVRLSEIALAVEQLETALADNKEERLRCQEQGSVVGLERTKQVEKELTDRKAERQVEREQIEMGLTQEWQFEVDVQQLIDDFKELGNCQARLSKLMRSYASAHAARGGESDTIMRNARASTKKVVQETDEMVNKIAKLFDKENIRSLEVSRTHSEESDKGTPRTSPPSSPKMTPLSPTSSNTSTSFTSLSAANLAVPEINSPTAVEAQGGTAKPIKPARLPRGSAVLLKPPLGDFGVDESDSEHQSPFLPDLTIDAETDFKKLVIPSSEISFVQNNAAGGESQIHSRESLNAGSSSSVPNRGSFSAVGACSSPRNAALRSGPPKRPPPTKSPPPTPRAPLSAPKTEEVIKFDDLSKLEDISPKTAPEPPKTAPELQKLAKPDELVKSDSSPAIELCVD